ncbi:hypothetical protein REPUB_Repub17cG0056400 [Reevesia pubescens]
MITMDLYTYIQPIEGVLALLLVLYVFWRNIPKNSKKSNIPEPSGSWPIIGHLHLLGGNEIVCKKLGAMADKFGPLYSLKLGSRRVLVVSSWEIAKDCLTNNDRTLATRASIAAGKHMGYNNAIFAFAPYGEYWRNIRKIATIELLSSYRLEKLKHVRFSEIDLFIKELFGRCAQNSADNCAQVAMNELLERLTFNINLRMIVGKPFSSSSYAQVNSEPWRYKKAIKQTLYLFGIFVLADALPWLEWMDIQGHVHAMKKTAKELDSVISVWLEDHLRKKKENQGSCESDFMDVMLANLPEDAVISGHTRDTIVKATTLLTALVLVENDLPINGKVCCFLDNKPYSISVLETKLPLSEVVIPSTVMSDSQDSKFGESGNNNHCNSKDAVPFAPVESIKKPSISRNVEIGQVENRDLKEKSECSGPTIPPGFEPEAHCPSKPIVNDNFVRCSLPQKDLKKGADTCRKRKVVRRSSRRLSRIQPRTSSSLSSYFLNNMNSKKVAQRRSRSSSWLREGSPGNSRIVSTSTKVLESDVNSPATALTPPFYSKLKETVEFRKECEIEAAETWKVGQLLGLKANNEQALLKKLSEDIMRERNF